MIYRRITSDITGSLKLAEAYTFVCMAMKSDFKTMESYINEDTLAEYVGVDRRTVQRHIKKMKDEKVVQVSTTAHIKDGKPFLKNKYTLPTRNYVLISEHLIKEDIRREMKGFLVMLKTQCINHTSICNFSTKILADKMDISKSTVDRYLNKCEELGYIRWNKAKMRITILRKDLFIETNGKETGDELYVD